MAQRTKEIEPKPSSRPRVPPADAQPPEESAPPEVKPISKTAGGVTAAITAAKYAFGEMDEEGKAEIASFAAQITHRSDFDFMPVEGRVYFTRKAP